LIKWLTLLRPINPRLVDVEEEALAVEVTEVAVEETEADAEAVEVAVEASPVETRKKEDGFQ